MHLSGTSFLNAEVVTRCGDVHRQQPGQRLTLITHATPALAETGN
jgi:hypothetical protein